MTMTYETMGSVPDRSLRWLEWALERAGDWWRGFCYWSPDSVDHDEWLKDIPHPWPLRRAAGQMQRTTVEKYTWRRIAQS